MRPRACVLILVVFAGFVVADEKPPLIKPADARRHLNEVVTVEMAVESTGKSGRMAFLNSNKDFRAEDNFAVIVRAKALEEFARDKVENVEVHFKGKTIHVTGRIELYQFKPQISVEEAKQVAIVEKK